MEETKMNMRCMKCKKQVEVSDYKEEPLNNPKRPNAIGYRGKCPNCGTTTYRIGKKE
jgi:Zn finger protein HypA/HybF involved in hydrogenase expression